MSKHQTNNKEDEQKIKELKNIQILTPKEIVKVSHEVLTEIYINSVNYENSAAKFKKYKYKSKKAVEASKKR